MERDITGQIVTNIFFIGLILGSLNLYGIHSLIIAEELVHVLIASNILLLIMLANYFYALMLLSSVRFIKSCGKIDCQKEMAKVYETELKEVIKKNARRSKNN